MYVINMFCLIYENLFIKEKTPSLNTIRHRQGKTVCFTYFVMLVFK